MASDPACDVQGKGYSVVINSQQQYLRIGYQCANQTVWAFKFANVVYSHIQ